MATCAFYQALDECPNRGPSDASVEAPPDFRTVVLATHARGA